MLEGADRGLATAVALKREGWHVRVFERAAHGRELGFALLLGSNAVASLQRLGLEQRVIESGESPEVGEVRGSGGRLLRRFDLGQVRHLLPQPPVVVLRLEREVSIFEQLMANKAPWPPASK